MTDKKDESMSDWIIVDENEYIRISAIIKIKFENAPGDQARAVLTLNGGIHSSTDHGALEGGGTTYDGNVVNITGRDKVRNLLSMLNNSYLKQVYGKKFSESTAF